MAGFRPRLLIDAAAVIPEFGRPVLLIWGEQCQFFPVSQARRLASDCPHAALVTVPGAKTWVPRRQSGRRGRRHRRVPARAQ